MFEASYVQNTASLHFTQGFCRGAPVLLNIARARDALRDVSDRAQAQETKGFALSGATEGTLASVYKQSFIGDIRNCKRPVLMPLIGYARVSTEDQTWGNRGPSVP
jgi:hypothetical protein